MGRGAAWRKPRQLSLGPLLTTAVLTLEQSCPADRLTLVLAGSGSRSQWEALIGRAQAGYLLPLSVSSVCVALRAPVPISGDSSFWLSPGLSHLSFQRRKHLPSFRFSSLDSLIPFLIVNQDPRLKPLLETPRLQ